jgi:hypothetical protein
MEHEWHVFLFRINRSPRRACVLLPCTAQRYETQWMGYMRGLGLGEYDVVVGHASSAEALLR